MLFTVSCDSMHSILVTVYLHHYGNFCLMKALMLRSWNKILFPTLLILPLPQRQQLASYVTLINRRGLRVQVREHVLKLTEDRGQDHPLRTWRTTY